MGEITFSGLATGLDTDSIIESLMEIEREPIDSLENDIDYFEAETDAFSTFSGLLENLLTAVDSMDTVEELSAYSATSSDKSALSASADNSAVSGTYHVQVVSLAEAQKDVSAAGFSDTSSTTLSGTLTIGETSIEYSSISLDELVDMVNDSDSGVQASIINDGSDDGYRLVLTAEQAGETIEISGTGSVEWDTASDGHTYSSSQAHVIVDNVDIYSNSNTLTEAIQGVTLDLLEADEDETLTVEVGTDSADISSLMNQFVSSYNNIVEWITDQSENSWGNDSSILSVKRKMQNFLTTQVTGSETLTSLVQLGISTDYETGTISFDSSALDEALEDDPDAVFALLAGDDDTDGVADLFNTYLEGQTDGIDGVYARRKESNDANIKRMENRIEMMELRLEKREEYLRDQYTALEELVSELNSMTSYLDEISASSSSD